MQSGLLRLASCFALGALALHGAGCTLPTSTLPGMDAGGLDAHVGDAALGDVLEVDVGHDGGPADAGTCSLDSPCGAGTYCASGHCVPTLQAGARCTSGQACASTFCVDGVCCDRACDGACEGCTGALRGAGFDGECGPIAAGTDPSDECPAQNETTCGTSGTCDGASACARWPLGTICSATTCSAGVARPERMCDGTGTCTVAGTTTCSPYACGATDCRTSCTTDAECDASAFCSAGICVSHRPIGSACARANDCASGSCVDGVCCGSACTGGCMACAAVLTGAADGTCSPILAATDPDMECAASSTSTCGTDGFCDGAGACRLWSAATICAGASCASGVELDARLCDGAGTCAAGASRSCPPYVCSGSACATTCASDGDCSLGNYCSGGACTPKQSNGSSCTAPGACLSGSCVDDFCCNTLCSGTCVACAAALTGGTNGVCSGVVAGTDPGLECATSAASSCGTDGSCDGSGACRLWAGGTECVAQSCSGGNQANADLCDGAGHCIDRMTTSCAPYLCAGTACPTTCASDAACSSGNFCDATGHCVPTRVNGTICTRASECTSGSCVDGFCCNTACAGTCVACAASLTGGTSGTCAPVLPGTDPQNECAMSAASTCGTDGVCNGTGACELWANGTTCVAASCAAGVAQRADQCDGVGNCVDRGSLSCTPYVCSGSACAASCNADTDCTSGNFCSTNACVPQRSNGSLCTAGGQCTSGACVDGVCCNTACAGSCMACSAALTGGANGVCAAIPTGSDPQNECAATSASTCGSDGQCNGAGACRLWASGTVCAAASCAGSTRSLDDTCDGLGTCIDGGTLACSPYACSGALCRTTCTTDGDCASGDLCEVGSCRVPGSTALQVNGDFSGVLLPANPAYGDVGTSFTIELWFRPSTANVDGLGVLYQRRADMGDYTIRYSVGDDGLVRFEPWLDDSSAAVSLVSSTQPSLGAWHHVAGVVAGTSVRLYLDGVLEDSATAPSSITWLASDMRATAFPEYATFIGYTRSPGDGGAETAGRFIGALDDVRVSAVARYSGASITLPYVMASDASTVGLWTFEEASGAGALDTSPAATLDGTIQGTTRVVGAR